MNKTKDTRNIKDIVKICIKQILVKYPFYGHLLLGVRREFNEEVPIAAVTIKNTELVMLYNIEGLRNFSNKDIKFIILHETFHLAYRHLFTKYLDAHKANIAMDCCINSKIEQHNNMIPPEGAMLPKNFNLPDLKTTKYYYENLPEDLKENSTLDSHIWEELKDKPKDLQDVILKGIEGKLKEAYKKSKGQGIEDGDLSNYLEELTVIKEPVINWANFVKQFIQGAILRYKNPTKRRRNKRFPKIKEYKGKKIRYKPDCIFYLDMSGSVSKKEYELIFSQLHHIFKTINVYICPFDTKIYTPYKYNGEFKLPKSNGGTSFTPVAKHFNESDFSFGIIATDGEAEQISFLNKPFLWLVTTNLEVVSNQPGNKILIT